MGKERLHPDDVRNEPSHGAGGRDASGPDTSGHGAKGPDEPALGFEARVRETGVDLVCWRCGYSRVGLMFERPCPECGSPAVRPHDMDPDASVWDEPTTSAVIAGETPADATTYARWLEARLAERDVGRSWVITGLIALCAGPLAVIGAFWGSGQTTFSVFALVVFGPVVEEVAKLAAPTYLVERRPFEFLTRAQILICGASAGLVFAAIENLIYLYVYVPNPSPGLVVWRWTVCVALHTGCSMIGAIGLASAWRQGIEERRRADLAGAARWLVLAIVIHGAYNGLALVLQVGGVGS